MTTVGYDVLVTGGELIDGTGAARRVADVGITAERIVAVGDLRGSAATRTIDAHGQLVTPGFIDMLGHSYYSLFLDRSATSKVLQGVTLEVTGERLGAGPVLGAARDLVRTEGLRPLGLDIRWTSHADYRALIDTPGIALNLACTVPAALLRASVSDPWRDRPLSRQQLGHMCRLLAESFDNGAVGLTFVLEEAPCCFLRTSEIAELLGVVAEHGRLAMFHLRDEGREVLAALDEALRLIDISGVRAEILHLKVLGADNVDLLPQLVCRVEHARRRGVDVEANIYPYTAAGLALQQLVPGLVRHNPAALAQRLRGSAARRRELLRRLGTEVPQTLWEGTRLATVAPGAVARPFTELAAHRGMPPAELALELLMDAEDWVHLSVECMSDRHLEMLLACPWVGIASDGASRSPNVPALANGPVHPREYGTFPRYLREFVYRRGILTDTEAVRRVTSRAADRLGIPDRGRIAPGAAADILVFDPLRFTDRATLERPNQLAEGMRFVLVNGCFVVDEGVRTPALPGGVVGLRGQLSTEV
jgi:N-acyl-D-aspartate/D-glutamate deacylase